MQIIHEVYNRFVYSILMALLVRNMYDSCKFANCMTHANEKVDLYFLQP